MFNSKISIVLREDLAVWQKLNVTAFLMSGIVGQDPAIIGKDYIDADNNRYNPMSVQPIIILKANAEKLRTIHQRALTRQIKVSAYIEEMFATGHDEANREVFSLHAPKDANLVGIAIRAEKKLVDKVTKGAKMHD